eukprot:gene1231-1354_t
MVFRMIVGCPNKREDVPGHYCRVPAMITNQGEAYKDLTKEQRRKGLAAISRIGLTKSIIWNHRVCFRHFVSGIATNPWDRFNIDWVPTLNLGHKKQQKNMEAVVNRAEGTRQRRKRIEESLEEEVRQNQQNQMNLENIMEIFNEAEFEDPCEDSLSETDEGLARGHQECKGKLLPGDLILADRGFIIQQSVWYHEANINIPAYTRGKDQLDPVDVEKTPGIANVPIHIERVIGSLRQKYTILQSTLPTDYLTCSKSGHNQEKSVPLLNRIIRVCSALMNLCPAIVPFD